MLSVESLGAGVEARMLVIAGPPPVDFLQAYCDNPMAASNNRAINLLIRIVRIWQVVLVQLVFK
jgi:hypothetical protein